MPSPDLGAETGPGATSSGEPLVAPAPAGPPAASTEDGLPPALRSMWRLCMLGYRFEPSLMGIAFVLALLAAVPDALFAVWFKFLGEGVTNHDGHLLELAVGGMAVSSVATWFLQTVSTRVQRRFRDKVTIALEAHVASLQATIPTIAHQERPEYLDRLSILREQVFVLDHMYMAVFSTAGWLLRLGLTVGILATVNPLLILLVVFALPTVAATSWRPAVERQAQERGAQSDRLARHLFTLATSAATAKEVRLLGTASDLTARRRASWEQWYGPLAAARSLSAAWYAFGWAIFGVAYAGAVVLVATGARASAASVLLVLAAGSRLSTYVGATVSEIGFLRGMWMDGSRRLAWLEDYAAAASAKADLAPPGRLSEGVRFEKVSFTYPGATRPALEEIDLFLPAGTVVAIVGENGAGKTTLVKLLAKLYEPSHGRILVDGVDLARIRADAWRERLSGAFQDFFRFELRASQTVGLGDVARLDETEAVESALVRAGATDVVAGLPHGLATQLGPSWDEGVEVSFGQWQKLALARGFMRDAPLITSLDEPTAALDAETEHALFEHFTAGARYGGNGTAAAGSGSARAGGKGDVDRPDGGAEVGAGDLDVGGITILVSHRFSTVRMADLIVVLDGSHLAEVGTHEELVAAGGQYSELYEIQARAYRR